MGRVWRSIRGIREKNEGGSFRKLLGERIVKYEAVHSTVSRRNRVCSHRHLVRLAFAIPLYRNEALRSQLFLGRRGVVFGSRGTSQLVKTLIELKEGGRRIFQRLRGSCIACSWMFENSKISTIQSAYTSPTKQLSYIDFLCGCTLQDMVCPSSTLTQRTIYDYCVLAFSCPTTLTVACLLCYESLIAQGLPLRSCANSQ